MPRACRDDRERKLHVVVVEDFEAVVPPVADRVEATDQLGDVRAVDALAGKDAKMARGVHSLIGRADLLPHEVGKLHEQDLLGVDLVQRLERVLVASMWYESTASPRFARSARCTRSHACGISLTWRPHESASYAIRIPNGTASIASLRKSRTDASESSVACVDVLEQTSSTFEPSPWHIVSMARAISILYA